MLRSLYSVCCLCVNVCCTAATGCQPNCGYIYIYIYIYIYTYIHRHNRKEKTTMVWPHKKDARREDPKINYGVDTRGEKEKRTPKKNVDGRSTSSHDIKKPRIRSVEKQGGMTFGFRKTATAVK